MPCCGLLAREMGERIVIGLQAEEFIACHDNTDSPFCHEAEILFCLQLGYV